LRIHKELLKEIGWLRVRDSDVSKERVSKWWRKMIFNLESEHFIYEKKLFASFEDPEWIVKGDQQTANFFLRCM